MKTKTNKKEMNLQNIKPLSKDQQRQVMGGQSAAEYAVALVGIAIAGGK